MFLVAIALLQAAPSAAPTSTNDAQPAAAAQAEPVDDAPEGPKMKKICRKVMDPRVPTLASRQTVCKYVPADEDKSSKR
jgi:hypothetical protein